MKKSSEYQAKYDAKNVKRYSLKLNIASDKDIIEKLENVGQVQTYIKEAIRRDIKRESE